MTTPLSSHGIIVGRAPSTTPTVYTDIAELSMVALPELKRNEFDAYVQNKNIDNYVIGALRRGSVQLGLNFIPNDPSHDHLTGLYSAIIANSIDGYKFYQTFSGLLWVASGQVQALIPKTPTDGKMEVTATIRFSGAMSLSSNSNATSVTLS